VLTSFVGKVDVTTPTKYDKDVKAKAIRLVHDHASDYDTEWAAILAIRPISCGPARAPLSLHDTAVPPPRQVLQIHLPIGSARLGTPVSV
jgi:hypothetical protein